MSPAPPKDSESIASTSGPSRVELATLLVSSDVLDQYQDGANHPPPDLDGEEAILQLHDAAAAETSAALAEHDIERGGSGGNTTGTTIQAVVDLTTLSELARAAEDDFVIGLHREANDHHYNPADSTESLDEVDEEEEEEKIGEKQPLIPPKEEGETTEVVLDVTPFAETLADAVSVADTTFTPFESSEPEAEYPTTTMTEDDVQLGHDAFLLELPQQPGETDHQYVLALPEFQHTGGDEDDDVSALSTDHHFPMLERAMTLLHTHLPTDIKDVQLEASAMEVDKITTELHLDLVVKRQVPFIGYAILIAGFFALASVGTALELQGDEVTATMKSFWRVSATALALLPFALISICRDGLPKLTHTQWVMFPLAALAYGEMTAAFVIALSMTSLANSFILSNLTSLVLIAGKVICGVPIIFSEVLGATIGFIGAAICAGDTSRSDGQAGEVLDSHPHEFLGNMIALSASFGMAAYLNIAKDLRANCDLYVFMFVIMFLGSMFILLYMILSGEHVTFSTHHNHGIFGWMTPTPDRLPLELYMVFSCNLLGTMGYIAVLKYFDSVVVGTVMLMEPVVAAFFGFWAGLDPLPGMQTWIGDAIVTIGSGIVMYSGSKKTEHIDATKAVRPRSNTIDTYSHSVVMKGPT